MSTKSIFRNANLKKASTIMAVLFFRLEDPSTSSTEDRENVSS